MRTQALKGMRDLLPKEQRLRDYIQNRILDTYRSSGFTRISTPIIEDIENLNKSDGGDNLNLIFKVMKRGKKLEAGLASGNPDNICDMGLRYDLTLPLARFYAANRNELPTPFKVIQTDRVFRAEQPQKGRLREFVQCDIDILGDASNNAEIELIDVSARALLDIGFNEFTININDRRILRSMLAGMGFDKESLDSVCITFDKLDKIGVDGIKQELIEKEFDSKAIETFVDFISSDDISLSNVAKYCEDKEIIKSLENVIETVKVISNGAYDIVYSPNLVRGQGYYTGMVFEVTSPHFKGAVAGGGRYDNMIGRFIGESVPAVGFSIGFERICGILIENGYEIPLARKKIALLYKAEDNFADVLSKAKTLRDEYEVTVLAQAKKVGKQFNQLEKAGFYGAAFMLDDELKIFGQSN